MKNSDEFYLYSANFLKKSQHKFAKMSTLLSNIKATFDFGFLYRLELLYKLEMYLKFKQGQ